MIYIGKDYYKLSNGRKIYAYAGIIGFMRDFTLTNGYDHTLTSSIDSSEEDYELTIEDKHEIADFMISEWMRFKESLR